MDKVNKTAALNICSAVLLQGMAFLTTPIFTRILGPAQYGIYAVFNSWVLIVTCIMGLGVSNTLGSGRYQFEASYYEFRNTILLFGSIISIGILALAIIFIHQIAAAFGYEEYIVMLLLTAAFGHYIINFVQNAYVYEKKAKYNFILSVLLSIISIGLSLILIPLFTEDNKYLGRIYGATFPYIIIAVIMWVVFFMEKPIKLHRKYCQYGWNTGFPVIFHLLAQNILTQSDRVMMQYMNIDNSEIGIYSLFYSLAGIMGTILNALNISWCPFYYDDLNNKEWKNLKLKCKNYIELYTALTICFLLLTREASYILAGKEYWCGIDIIPIITLAFYFTFMYQFPVNFEFFYRKTKIIAIGTLGAAVLNIILNMLLIPSCGMYGAAIATAMSYAALFIFHYLIVIHMKEHFYHLNVKIFLVPLLCMIGTILIFYILSNSWQIRWLLALSIGFYEMWVIYKRKTIF